jgi:HAE1 family hydrophobic/amphiphilic exporter-1
VSLPRLSIRRPVAVAMFFLGVVFLGVLCFARLPVDLLPDVAYPRLLVYTAQAGAAPAEVERFVTQPVEQALGTVPGLEKVASVTREGESVVTLRFAWGTDMDFAALGVRERLDGLRGALPEAARRPVVLRTDPRSEPVMGIAVAPRGPGGSVQEITESVVKRRLEQIDGVAEATLVGGAEREIHVEVDSRRLESLGLTIADVARALRDANVAAPGGTVRLGRYQFALRTMGELQSPAEIEAVPVAPAAPAGAVKGPPPPVALGELARVSDGFREAESRTRFDGRPSLGLLVFKNAGANTVQVAARVEHTLAELAREYPDVETRVASSQAGFISSALSNVVQEVVLGAVLSFLVLFLFLREVRYPLAVVVAIPISVVATFALLQAMGMSLNIMSLGGLALGVGMLMDNSIVVLENVFRHRELGLRAAAAAAVGTEEVQRAVVASTLTTVAVFGPIVYLEGVAGQLLKPLAVSVGFSLLSSIAVACTLLPMLAARWGDGAAVPPSGLMGRAAPLLDAFDAGFGAFARAYERVLHASLARRGATLLAAGGLLALGVAVGLRLERRVLPVVDQGGFRLRVALPAGTPMEVTDSLAVRLESRVRADPAVDAVFSRVGRQPAVAGMDDRQSGVNTAVVDVHLRAGESTARALARLRPRLASLPAGAVTLQPEQATALGRLLGGGDADLSVRVRGEDADVALAYAERVRARLAPLPTLANVRMDTPPPQPELRVEIDRERAAAFAIEPSRVSDAVQEYMKGSVATQLLDFDRRVPVVVRLPDAERHDAGTLQTLRVDGVPLRELVRTAASTGPAEIHRMDQARVVLVKADLTAGLGQAAREVREALRTLPPPPRVRVEVGGENEEMRRGVHDLGLAFALAVALVYMLLAAEFESLLHPFVVLLAVPLSAVGATLALWVAGAGINTMSLIGMVILVGIVDNDAVVKVDFINQMRRQGMSRRDAIHAAGRARLRPIVMNTVTAMLGLLPMALGIGPGAELQAPLAVVVFGGLLSATLLTLVVIPVSYDVLDEWAERLRQRRGAA